MDFRTYWRSLTEPQRRALAKRAGTSVDYIEMKLINANPTKRNQPRRPLLARLALACEQSIAVDDLVSFFVTDGVRQHMDSLRNAN